ncbi:MAG: SDR family oxidoreductase [Deltaproteobacteria bacterium]|nr:SDR family oxidoreductase [Deltaproteobacteria bacterium]
MSKRVWIVGGSGALGTALRASLMAQSHVCTWTWCTRGPEGLGDGATQLDVRDVDAIERAADAAVAHMGGLDALVYLAAIGTTTGTYMALDEVTAESWDAFEAVNLRGAFFAARAFARRCDSAGGDVVFAGSIDGHKPVPAIIPYAATKGALEAMARAYAKELGPKNIRVNVVVPGMLERGISDILPKKLVEDYVAHDALSRKGTLDEAARVMRFFATRNRYVTGKSVAVDGGL